MEYSPLFDGVHEVTNEDVKNKMKYFIKRAEKGMDLYNIDKKASLELAKELREELRKEYKNNSLQRIENAYVDHDLFARYYAPAVHEALVSVTGAMSYEKLFGFLYDVKDYMEYHMPKE